MQAIAEKKKHMTVCMQEEIAKAVEGFLKTEEAASMGFDSKADVVTAAIREMLLNYGFFKMHRE